MLCIRSEEHNQLSRITMYINYPIEFSYISVSVVLIRLN